MLAIIRRFHPLSKALLTGLVCLPVIACAGMRETDETFVAHAESVRILGFSIPGDDMARADELVPDDWVVVSVRSTPADWTSLVGFLGNLLGIHQTVISARKD